MHLVLIAWLYVFAMLAATAASLAGALLFVTAGVLPVLLLVGWQARRLRRRRKLPPSAFEEHVHDRDDRDA